MIARCTEGKENVENNSNTNITKIKRRIRQETPTQPLKDHSKIKALFDMINLGNRPHWVKKVAKMRGIPPSIIDLDPNLSLADQWEGTIALDDEGNIDWSKLLEGNNNNKEAAQKVGI